MKNLLQAEALDEVRRRIASLTPSDARQWGLMTVNEMVCHVRDAYQLPISERAVTPMPPQGIPPGVMKWFALRAPMPWPQGIKTVPEVDQKIGGTRPLEFAADVSSLQASLDAFAAWRKSFAAHPVFGIMSSAEWMRWGYLHADHHLRQFGR